MGSAAHRPSRPGARVVRGRCWMGVRIIETFDGETDELVESL